MSTLSVHVEWSCLWLASRVVRLTYLCKGWSHKKKKEKLPDLIYHE